MKQEAFEKKHQATWDELKQWLDLQDKLTKEPGTLNPEDFPKVYREVCQHLSLATARQYSPDLIQNLNSLSLRGHKHLYQARAVSIRAILKFFTTDFPVAFRKHWRYQLAAGLMLFGPMLALIIAIQFSPPLVYSVMDYDSVQTMEYMYDPASERFGRERDADSDFLMFGFYIYNNVSIAFRTFAGGILGGIGTMFFLLFNGVYIGAVAGHLTAIDYGEPFWSFVIGHGAFELTAIFICGSAGLMIGYALWAPRRRTRLQALQHAAKEALPLIFGSAAMLILAAVIEAFWSSTNWIGFNTKFIVGGIYWVLVILYFAFMGKKRDGT